MYVKGKMSPIRSHGESEGEWRVVLPSFHWHFAQLGRQSCQLYPSSTLYSLGNRLVFFSGTNWVYPSTTSYGQKHWLTRNFQESHQRSKVGSNKVGKLAFNTIIFKLIIKASLTNLHSVAAHTTDLTFRSLFRRVRKIAKSDYQLRHARLSVHMEQLDSH